MCFKYWNILKDLRGKIAIMCVNALNSDNIILYNDLNKIMEDLNNAIMELLPSLE